MVTGSLLGCLGQKQKGGITASRPDVVPSWGWGAQVSSAIWGLSISGPQFFNLQNEGLGITESLCDSVKSGPEWKFSF